MRTTLVLSTLLFASSSFARKVLQGDDCPPGYCKDTVVTLTSVTTTTSSPANATVTKAVDAVTTTVTVATTTVTSVITTAIANSTITSNLTSTVTLPVSTVIATLTSTTTITTITTKPIPAITIPTLSLQLITITIRLPTIDFEPDQLPKRTAGYAEETCYVHPATCTTSLSTSTITRLITHSETASPSTSCTKGASVSSVGPYISQPAVYYPVGPSSQPAVYYPVGPSSQPAVYYPAGPSSAQPAEYYPAGPVSSQSPDYYPDDSYTSQPAEYYPGAPSSVLAPETYGPQSTGYYSKATASSSGVSNKSTSCSSAVPYPSQPAEYYNGPTASTGLVMSAQPTNSVACTAKPSCSTSFYTALSTVTVTGNSSTITVSLGPTVTSQVTATVTSSSVTSVTAIITITSTAAVTIPASTTTSTQTATTTENLLITGSPVPRLCMAGSDCFTGSTFVITCNARVNTLTGKYPFSRLTTVPGVASLEACADICSENTDCSAFDILYNNLSCNLYTTSAQFISDESFETIADAYYDAGIYNGTCTEPLRKVSINL